jgi:hypothetical protein
MIVSSMIFVIGVKIKESYIGAPNIKTIYKHNADLVFCIRSRINMSVNRNVSVYKCTQCLDKEGIA